MAPIVEGNKTSRHVQRPAVTSAEDKLIVLVGMPGCGKTSVGRRIAKQLGRAFVDTDHEVEHRVGCSIRSYFEREGEAAFREIEGTVIDELTLRHRGILATGGGAILREDSRMRLKARGYVVYLRSSPEECAGRLRHDAARPLLPGGDPLEQLQELFALRDKLYQDAAHMIVETGRPSVNAQAALVRSGLQREGVIPQQDENEWRE